MKKRLLMLIMASMTMTACSFSGAGEQGKEAVEDTSSVFVSQEYSNRIGNLNNCGYVCEADGWICYMNSEDRNTLYKMTSDGQSVTKLNDNWSEAISIAGDYVYYSNWDDNVSFYRIKMDGSEEEKLVECAYTPVVDGEYVYYADGNDNKNVYRMSLNERTAEKISAIWSEEITVTEDYIYFLNGDDLGNIYRMDKNGENVTQVSTSAAKFLNFYGEWIYYINRDMDGMIYKLNINTGEEYKVSDLQVASMNVNDDTIYFINTSQKDNHCLYSMDLDGSNPEKLIDETTVMYPGITENYVFYQQSGTYTMHRLDK